MRLSTKKKEVKAVYTLSKYFGGQHTFDESSRGDASFAESFVPLHNMIEVLRRHHGVPLGSKIEVTMKVAKCPR